MFLIIVVTIIFSIILLPAVIGGAITPLFRRLPFSYVPLIVSVLFAPLILWNDKAWMFSIENSFKKEGVQWNASLSFGFFLLHIISVMIFPYFLGKWGAVLTNKAISFRRVKNEEQGNIASPDQGQP